MDTSAYQDFRLDDSATETKKDREFNGKVNSTVFLVSFVLLLVLGLIMLYSSSYYYALEESGQMYSYVLKQTFFVVIGMLVSSFFFVVNEKTLKIIIAPVFLLLICACVYSFFSEERFFGTELFKNIAFLVWALYLSLYFSNRESLEKLRELILPVAFSLIMFSSLLMRRGLDDALVFLVITIVLFTGGMASAKALVLLLFFIAVPLAAWVLTSADNIRTMLGIFIRDYGRTASGGNVSVFKSVISSGGFFGRGLGEGFFKRGGNPVVFKEGIFLNIAEETGFAGVLIVFVLFALLLFCGYRTAKHSRSESAFVSNVNLSVTFILFCNFVQNILMVLGIIPFGNYSLPFFSFGNIICITIVECAIIYKNAITVRYVRENEPEEKMKTDIYDYEATQDQN